MNTRSGCGDRTLTCAFWVMSLTSYQMLHRNILKQQQANRLTLLLFSDFSHYANRLLIALYGKNHGYTLHGIEWHCLIFASQPLLTAGSLVRVQQGEPWKKHLQMQVLFSWQGQKDLNPRHAVLETAALPTELYPYLAFAFAKTCETPVCIPHNSVSWWTIRDSNPGPTGYEPVALTNWANGPFHNACILYRFMMQLSSIFFIFFIY